MEFGVPREVRDLEMRVGLTPAAVLALTQAGHIVYVESGAGAGARFSDEDYRDAGGQIVYSAAEVYGRSDVVAKLSRPTAAEHQLFRPGQTIFAFFHLAVAMGVPTVGLFTPADGRQWYPQGREKVRVLKITKGRKVVLDQMMAEITAVTEGRVSQPSRVIAAGVSETVAPTRPGQEA